MEDNSLKFRKAVFSDKEKIVEIYEQAKKFIRTLNIDQWQNNYPNPQSVNEDIEKGISFVAVSGGEIVATVAFDFCEEPTYNVIHEGHWLSSAQYAVIHRMAVSDNFRGKAVAKFVLQKCEEMCSKEQVYTIKIDTHKGNLVMQRFLKKNEFVYCGKIYLNCEGEKLRYAYQKLLK